jgi:N-acetylglutamate synthase-like GNAT family acetyltransferase
MQILKAEEKDIVEALYLIKTSFDYNNVSENEWRPPIPEYGEMKEEVNKGELFLLRKNKVTFGTFSLANKMPESFNKVQWEDNNNDNMVIKRIAVFPGWFSDDLGNELISFIEQYTKEHNYSSIKSNAYSKNEEMNSLFKNMGFTFQGEAVLPGKEAPYYFYEKVFK